MIQGIQGIGILFGLAMMYFSYVYYKRKEISLRGYVFWNFVWIGFMVLIMIPKFLLAILRLMGFTGIVQFLTIIGFLFMFTLIFYMYRKININQKKLEYIVKKLALKKKK